jgi:large subunit ribosomal protein L2
MGKRILQRRAGKGTSTYRSPTWKRIGPASYPSDLNLNLEGTLIDLAHDPGRGVPLAVITSGNGKFNVVAADGSYLGQKIKLGKGATPESGNILPLSEVPDGARVFNVELRPGDGGALARTSGGYCTVLSHTEAGTTLTLPSGASKTLSSLCRATIGVAAAGGRMEKPFLNAGAKYKLMRAKPTKYPRVRGVAMNAVSHPHGGGNHPSVSRSTTISRRMPPGRKVGHIAARRAGRRKG